MQEIFTTELWGSHSDLHVTYLELYINQNNLSYDLFIMQCSSALAIKKRIHYPEVKYVHFEGRDKCYPLL